MIVDKTPDQLKLPFVLWDSKAVRELIARQYGVTVATRTIGDYLKCWNFTPQRPAKRVYEQQPEAVQKWVDENVFPGEVYIYEVQAAVCTNEITFETGAGLSEPDAPYILEIK